MSGILKVANRFDNILRSNRVKNAGVLSDIGHVTLDLVGLIPGVGEIADVSNALWFCKEGEWLFAALSLISAIPELGDVVGKGGKVVAWITKYCGKTGELVLKYGPKAARKIVQLKDLVTQFRSNIDKILDKAEESKYFKDYVPQMRKAIDVFTHQDVKEKEDDSEEPTSTEKAAYINHAKMIKLANRFQKILKKADEPDTKLIAGALAAPLKRLGIAPISDPVYGKLHAAWQSLATKTAGDKNAFGYTFNVGFEVANDGSVTFNVMSYQGDDSFIDPVIVAGLNQVIAPMIGNAVREVVAKKQDPTYTLNNWLSQVSIAPVE